MEQRWTLHVENFARIKEADIEISPLMCFVGDNNSGKSYMMSLLWGLIVSGEFFLKRATEDTLLAKKCTEWVMENTEKETVINKEVQQMYVAWFNEVMESCKDEFVKYVFNYQLSIGKIEIRNFRYLKKITFATTKDYNTLTIKHGKFGVTTYDWHDNKRKFASINTIICWSLLMNSFTSTTSPVSRQIDSIYFPASRTGFVLTYPQIASQTLKDFYSLGNKNILQNKLTLPYINFLQFLVNVSTRILITKRDKELIKFINRELISGKIDVAEDGDEMRYQPEDLPDNLPMSVASSVITEVASLSLIFGITPASAKHLVIEEPEAHLHPALQKKIAQFIIRLTNSNTPVWITTHSDTILQHFNNMIKLKNHPDCKKILKEFSYTKDDLLGENEIALYQFKRKECETTIERLKSGKYGFVVPTFNDANEKLLEEILAFQEDD